MTDDNTRIGDSATTDDDSATTGDDSATTGDDSATDNNSPPPGPFAGSLGDPEMPVLRAHFRDVTRWAIGEAAGEKLGAARCDELADELAVILAEGLVQPLLQELRYQAEKVIERQYSYALTFDHEHQVRIDGYGVPEVVRIIKAVERLYAADPADVANIVGDVRQAYFWAESYRQGGPRLAENEADEANEEEDGD